jgi:hypothetical protein
MGSSIDLTLARRGGRAARLAQCGRTRAGPREVFLAWLLWLPQGADVAEAARREVARLDRAEPLPPEVAALRLLLVEAALTG